MEPPILSNSFLTETFEQADAEVGLFFYYFGNITLDTKKHPRYIIN